jgi:RNA polymerase sigma-70 factor (ECF subfamily)
MKQRLEHTQVFEQQRPALLGLAYRMLGTITEAEDAVQETFIRWHRADITTVEEPAKWLGRVCSRICLDSLKSARRKRETYVGPWLPEPVLNCEALSPHDRIELHESVNTAFLLILEQLTPLERAAFLLHDVFDYAYTDLARILDRSEAACRKMVSRSRENIKAHRPRMALDPARIEEMTDEFFAALESGDLVRLENCLVEDAEMWSDGGGKVLAARNVVSGANNVSRFLAGLYKKGADHLTWRRQTVNGMPGALLFWDAQLFGTFSLNILHDGRIAHAFFTNNPEKLARVRVDLEAENQLK